MTTTESDVLTPDGLRRLAAATGPCITLVLPMDGIADTRVRLKDAVRSLESQVEDKSILTSVAALAEQGRISGEGRQGALVVLRSPEIFEHFLTDRTGPEIVEAGEYFNIRSILSIAEKQRLFYILAISQKHVRVLRCTRKESEEVALPSGTPASLNDSKQTSKPDHDLDNRSSGGPSMGSMKGVMFGTTTDKENKDEYMVHFMTEIDKGVHTLLKESGAPLVVVAVEHELAQYKRINTYPHLVDPGVHGAPDGLKGGEMHKRALELLEASTPEPVRKILDHFDKQVGTGHASAHAQEIVKASHEGRVSHLLFQENAHYQGNFDEIRQKIKRHDDAIDVKHDLINVAAVQTLIHGGDVYVLSGDKMPNGVPLAAIFRYPSPTA